jgi:opacity protein-like surface antigen
MRRSMMVAGALACAAMLAVVPSAFGQAGAYLRVHAGASVLADSDLRSRGSIDARETGYETGVTGGIAGGYAFDPGAKGGFLVRPELEVSYRRNALDTMRAQVILSGAGVQRFDASGTLHAVTGFANLWLSHPIPGTDVRPYVGGGAGPARVWFDDVASPNAAIVDDGDTVLAGQVGAGLAIPISGRLDVMADYRYLAAETIEMTHVRGRTFEAELDGHSVSLGLRFRF